MRILNKKKPILSDRPFSFGFALFYDKSFYVIIVTGINLKKISSAWKT